MKLLVTFYLSVAINNDEKLIRNAKVTEINHYRNVLDTTLRSQGYPEVKHFKFTETEQWVIENCNKTQQDFIANLLKNTKLNYRLTLECC